MPELPPAPPPPESPPAPPPLPPPRPRRRRSPRAGSPACGNRRTPACRRPARAPRASAVPRSRFAGARGARLADSPPRGQRGEPEPSRRRPRRGREPPPRSRASPLEPSCRTIPVDACGTSPRPPEGGVGLRVRAIASDLDLHLAVRAEGRVRHVDPFGPHAACELRAASRNFTLLLLAELRNRRLPERFRRRAERVRTPRPDSPLPVVLMRSPPIDFGSGTSTPCRRKHSACLSAYSWNCSRSVFVPPPAPLVRGGRRIAASGEGGHDHGQQCGRIVRAVMGPWTDPFAG